MRRAPASGLIAIITVAVVFASSLRPAAAQEAVNYASVSGRVTDASGGVIVAADVTALQTETNVVSTTVTDGEGRFRFPYLRAGTYEFTVRAKGFAPARRQLTLTVGAAFDLPIAVAVGTVDSEITVSADSTLLEAARSQIAGTVSVTEVERLPLNGRNVLDVALLIPGVSPTNVGGGTQLFPETSAVPGVGISIGSQRNLSNNFMVDGLSANDDAAGLIGMSYGVDSIDQLQVVTSGGQAELGRALGGHVNIATRSGTNRLRTDASAYFRDDRFTDVNALSGQKLPMHQNQYGASAGGPIVRDRTFFFSSFEQRRLDQSGLVTIPSEVVDVINARLQQVGYRGPLVTTGIYPNPVDTTNVLAKADHLVSAANHFTVRYSLYDAASSNARGAGGTNAPSASAGLDNRDQIIAAGNVLALSPRTVVETRAQFADSDLKALPTDSIGPAVNIAGVAAFGTLSGSPTGRVNRMTQIVSNLSHQAGAHAVRAGVDVLYNDLDITFPRSARGSYAFSSLTNFLLGVYNNSGFTQTFGAIAVSQTNPNVGLYAQDEWRVGSRVTVNGGIRYDLQFLETINTDTNNVSPRVGVVWSPVDSRRTLIRASAGRFYDRIPLRAVANALLSAGNTTDVAQLRQSNVSLSPAQSGAPVFPNVLSAIVPTTTLVNFTTIDPNLQNAYSDQMSVEVEQQLGRLSTVSVGYQRLRGRHLIMQINQNVPTCAVVGANNGCRPNPTYANNNQYSSAGSSEYDGLHVSFLQRLTRWGSYRLSYSFSKSMNNVGEAFFNSPIDPFDLSKDWGRSDDDQRHRLVATGTINSPSTPATNVWEHVSHGFQLAGMLQYYSALPFNITTGANTIQGTAARPVVNGEFIERKAGEGDDFSTVSLRLLRTFRLGDKVQVDGLLEAFNVFNHRNDLARVTVFGTGAYPSNPAVNFGQVTVVGDPRSIQFGLRFRY
jgi:Carboxypeptidase regulatory-like domain/TonB dependent receptor-like, beta-barrel